MHLSHVFAVAAILVTASPGARAQEAAQPAATETPAADVDAFAHAAAQNSLSEVLMSTMALQKTTDKRVEEYAWTMLDHHARAMGDLAEALSPGAAPLPAEPSAAQSAILKQMSEMSGTQFDQAYFAHQLESHGAAVGVFEKGVQVADQQVANYAATTLPILRAHLDIAKIRQAQPPQPIPGQ